MNPYTLERECARSLARSRHRREHEAATDESIQAFVLLVIAFTAIFIAGVIVWAFS